MMLPDGRDRTGPDPLLSAHDVVLDYGRTRALDGVSIEVGPGEVVALVGASGSGKTSLLHCLSGLIRPTPVRWSTRARPSTPCPSAPVTGCAGRSSASCSSSASWCPSSPSSRTWRCPCASPATSGLARKRGRWTSWTAWAWATSVPAGWGEVSGGEMQRAAIARALVHRPSVVFADEPTGALDEDNRELVLVELLAAAADSGAAVVLVTHAMSLAGRADRCVSIAGGRLEPAR